MSDADMGPAPELRDMLKPGPGAVRLFEYVADVPSLFEVVAELEWVEVDGGRLFEVGEVAR